MSDSASSPRLLCLGLGYTAERLARRLAARGFAIVGTTRDVDRKRASLGVEARDWSLIAWQGRDPLPAEVIASATHVLHSIMPDAEGDPVLRWHADDVLRAAPTWIGYLSTTGVYGDHQGAWIDETTTPKPSKDRTRRRVIAEQGWQRLGAHVFRLAGIYGPGRSALERVEQGDPPIDKPGKCFNRIHVDDIANVLEASIARPRPGRVYDVADGEPASQVDVLGYAAELLGLARAPAIRFEQAELSPMARSFWDDDVKIRGLRIREELGVALEHPDYRAGLRACLAARGTADQ
ncbi:SDR family oxidoreductase [Nannocystaceae bacterium ST9]